MHESVAIRKRISSKDRFVAFAFASADVLFEVNPWGEITFAGGATHWLLGKDDDCLTGESLLDQVADDERALLKAVMNQTRIMGRSTSTLVRFGANGRRKKAVNVFGSFLPEYPDSVFLTIQSGRPHVMPGELKEASRDTDTGLLDVDSFARIATELATTQPEACANLFLTLLEVEGFTNLQEKLEGQDQIEFVQQIVSYLQAMSLDGAVAGRVAGEKFGVVHEGNLSAESIRAGFEQLPNTEGLEIRSADLTLDPQGMSEKDLARALAYTIKEFAEEDSDFDITNLAGAYTEMLADTKDRIDSFNQTVAKNEFDIVLQPIVEIQTGQVHHYEALSRIHELGPDASPYEFITFAEDAGVIADFDLAVCRKAIGQILHASKHSGNLSIAINVSGRSIQNERFVDELVALLVASPDVHRKLMFEITESSQIKNLDRINAILRKLRKMGHAICLDDFGAGAAGYQYLRALEADYVKIDGVYVKEALESPTGRAFLKSMAGLCKDLNIATIGECVETVEQAEFLKEIGVGFAQGYLFGRPEARVSGTCEHFRLRD